MRPILFFSSLLALASIAGAQDDPFGLPASNARLFNAITEAKRLAGTHLPAPDELGPGWSLPWESGVDGQPATEFTFWMRVRQESGMWLWPWFYGRTEDEVRRMLEETLPRLEQELAAEAEKTAFVTIANYFRIPLVIGRMGSAVALDSEPVASVRHASLVESALVLVEPESNEEFAAAAQALFDGLTPETEGADVEEVIAAIARDATLVRKFTTMTYVHAPEASLLDEDSARIPDYGQFKVTVHVVRRDALNEEIRDLTREDMARLEGELQAHLHGLAPKEAEASFSVHWEPRDLGDHSWVVRTEATTGLDRLPGYAAFFGRVRNGNAIVDVKGEGTYPADWLAQQLDYLLAAVDERTSQYGEDDWQ